MGSHGIGDGMFMLFVSVFLCWLVTVKSQSLDLESQNVRPRLSTQPDLIGTAGYGEKGGNKTYGQQVANVFSFPPFPSPSLSNAAALIARDRLLSQTA